MAAATSGVASKQNDNSPDRARAADLQAAWSAGLFAGSMGLPPNKSKGWDGRVRTQATTARLVATAPPLTDSRSTTTTHCPSRLSVDQPTHPPNHPLPCWCSRRAIIHVMPRRFVRSSAAIFAGVGFGIEGILGAHVGYNTVGCRQWCVTCYVL